MVTKLLKYIQQAFILSIIIIVCMYLFVFFMIYGGSPTFINDIIEFWTPIILIANIVIVAPTVVYQKLDMAMRQKFINFLTKLSLFLFLAGIILIHIPSFFRLTDSDFDWVVFAVYLFSIPFLLVLGVRFVIKKQTPNSSPSNISNIMSVIFHISLILWSSFIIFVSLQAMLS